MKFILRLAVNAVALYAAVALLNGNGLLMEDTSWINFFWLALIFGAVNAILKPILNIVGCLVSLFTLGLGFLLVNMALFYFTSLIGRQFGVIFEITSFWGAFFGSVITSLVSMVLNRLIRD
jgi:putative membrane protein